MANMTFKANLMPDNSSGQKELGSSTSKWKINGFVGSVIEYIAGTQTASTNVWTGVTADAALTTGKIIAYQLPYAGTSTAATLTLTLAGGTTTSAYPVYAGTVALTTHYGAGSILIMTFDGSKWRTNPYYDTNTNTLLRTYASSTNLNVPLIGQSSAASTTAAWTSYTNTSKDWYGVIPNDDAKRAKINLSTGVMTVPGGITANLVGNVTGDVTGDLTGNVTGDVTGDLTGDVTGNLSGNVTGNVTGNLSGNVTGNVTGNVAGNLTGNVTGDVTGDLTGNADTATAANITTTSNAIAYYTDTAGTFGSLASGNGALYATTTDGGLQFGTLQVGQGGTGATTFTANRILKGNGTSAIAASGITIDASNNITGAVGITASGVISTTNTTASTSTTTGAIKSAGGIAAAGQVTATRLAANGSNTSYNLYVNGSSYLNGNSTVKTVIGTSSSTYGSTLPSSGTEGQIFFQLSDGINTAGKITTVAATTNTKYYIVGTEGTGAFTPYVATPNTSASQNVGGVYFNGSSGVLFGAAWNDYAEYRQKKDIDGIPYGYVVIENGDDTVSLSTERLQPCGQIISDTFGFILGPEENSLPIALCGRVLTYPYEDRNSFSIGDAVCTAPDGKISKMTREEIREWPDRILGYVSSVPQYEIWKEKNIKVNGRIWIKVK